MIFVITGTEAFPFNRFIEKIDSLKENKIINEDIFIQLGSCSYIPKYCSWHKWLSFGSMRENIANADMVISHAGAGTTLLCLEMGKTPLLVTRRKEFGEHLDDHQVSFARIMEKLDYAVVAYQVSDLEKCIAKMWQIPKNKRALIKNNSKLVSFLNTWIAY
jgi:UDP-N-acetylglucosamine transferase subunit ALG13